MYLVPGWSGLELPRLRLLTPIGLLVAPFQQGPLLSGPEAFRKALKNAADGHKGWDVFMYRDSSTAPMLDLRRRIEAVMDVLDAMIRDGISLARSVSGIRS